ncbi:hypothetical protein Y032_0061g3210 [Ancylostoma ceylanicum]|uniref:Uncharacterized protein n=1 Tax=Ancylostoma ceylanicum TaxID=53326 RepID=A0A016U1N4_9BILA|nr:hypothetical protein Y032_0061g3210 [Ancylostoma ceylanicum]
MQSDVYNKNQLLMKTHIGWKCVHFTTIGKTRLEATLMEIFAADGEAYEDQFILNAWVPQTYIGGLQRGESVSEFLR